MSSSSSENKKKEFLFLLKHINVLEIILNENAEYKKDSLWKDIRNGLEESLQIKADFLRNESLRIFYNKFQTNRVYSDKYKDRYEDELDVLQHNLVKKVQYLFEHRKTQHESPLTKGFEERQRTPYGMQKEKQHESPLPDHFKRKRAPYGMQKKQQRSPKRFEQRKRAPYGMHKKQQRQRTPYGSKKSSSRRSPQASKKNQERQRREHQQRQRRERREHQQSQRRERQQYQRMSKSRKDKQIFEEQSRKQETSRNLSRRREENRDRCRKIFCQLGIKSEVDLKKIYKEFHPDKNQNRADKSIRNEIFKNVSECKSLKFNRFC